MNGDAGCASALAHPQPHMSETSCLGTKEKKPPQFPACMGRRAETRRTEEQPQWGEWGAWEQWHGACMLPCGTGTCPQQSLSRYYAFGLAEVPGQGSSLMGARPRHSTLCSAQCLSLSTAALWCPLLCMAPMTLKGIVPVLLGSYIPELQFLS